MGILVQPDGMEIPTGYDSGEISDGYHTFDELYRYRMLYNAAFFNMMKHDISDWGVHKSRFHSDGEPCFGGGWFIVMAYIPTKDGLKQISNHYEEEDWELFQIEERARADKWDGHTPEQVAERIESFLKGEYDERRSKSIA